jgi:DNA-binding transcriptional ArsR family regulator
MTDAGSDLARHAAIQEAARCLDDPIFAALQEPARIVVLRRLLELGRSDITAIAQGMPQERSVVSRHLLQLQNAGLVRSQRVGRQRFYEVDGMAIVTRLEGILERMRRIAPYCCP